MEPLNEKTLNGSFSREEVYQLSQLLFIGSSVTLVPDCNFTPSGHETIVGDITAIGCGPDGYTFLIRPVPDLSGILMSFSGLPAKNSCAARRTPGQRGLS